MSLQHPRTAGTADHTPPHGLVPADPGLPQGCAGARSLGQLFPLFTPGRKEELVSKGKTRGIVSGGASSGISGGQEMGTYSPSESDLQKDLEDVNSPPWACVSPQLPTAAGVTCNCVSRTNAGRRLGLYLRFPDPNFKPRPGCHYCQCPLSSDEDLLRGEKGDKGD